MIPATVITGFLGSGKTTLLNRLLRQPEARNSLVVINEFGEIGIDDLVVSIPAENVRLLANGCLCCETRGELAGTLARAWLQRGRAGVPRFERLWIETSGLADPVPIVSTIVSDERLGGAYRLERVAAVVDAVHAHAQLARHEEARKQVVIADVVVLGKTDLVDARELPELRAAIGRINPGAGIEVAPHGAIEPRKLLAAASREDVATWLERIDRARGGLDHAHRSGIGAFCMGLERPVPSAGLATWLSMLASLRGPQLLRVKGIVDVEGDPYVIDVVQSVVHAPRRLAAWPAPGRGTRLVFIVRGLSREDVESTFAAFSLDALPRAPGFDAAAYARFRQVADRFIDLEALTVPVPTRRP